MKNFKKGKKKSSYCTNLGHSQDFSELSWVAVEAFPQSRLLCWLKHTLRRGPGKGRGRGGGGGINQRGFLSPSSEMACLEDAGVPRSESWLQRERQWKIKQNNSTGQLSKKGKIQIKGVMAMKWVEKKKRKKEGWEVTSYGHAHEPTALCTESQAGVSWAEPQQLKISQRWGRPSAPGATRGHEKQRGTRRDFQSLGGGVGKNGSWQNLLFFLLCLVCWIFLLLKDPRRTIPVQSVCLSPKWKCVVLGCGTSGGDKSPNRYPHWALSLHAHTLNPNPKWLQAVRITQEGTQAQSFIRVLN